MTSTFTIPVGPIHPALKEPVSVQVEVDGERVVDADVILGDNHRGVEWIGTRRNNPVQNIFLAEKICGICSCTHSFAYVMAVEDLMELEVPPRAEYIRVIIAELDRIHSHLLWAGVAGHEIGFDTILHYTWLFREKVMDLIEYVSGNRVQFGQYMLGGARIDIPEKKYARIMESMDYFEKLFNKLLEMFVRDKTIAMRTKGIGILTKEDALKLCATGPTARGSSVPLDARKDHPVSAYADLDIEAMLPEMIRDDPMGDVFDKTLVRILEVKQSIDIIRECIKRMEPGPYRTIEKIPAILARFKKAEGEGIGRHEAPRGEVFHYVRTFEGDDKLYAWKVRAPSNINLLTWPTMLRGMEIADIPIVVASVDPCLSCTNRITYVDGSRRGFWTMEELHRMSVEKTRRLMR